MTKEQAVQVIRDNLPQLREIKSRCSNVTDEEMVVVSAVGRAVNVVCGYNRVRISACSIPVITDLSTRILRKYEEE